MIQTCYWDKEHVNTFTNLVLCKEKGMAGVNKYVTTRIITGILKRMRNAGGRFYRREL